MAKKSFRDHIKGLARCLTEGTWEVRRTIWPYEDGYGTYNARRNIVLDTGLTKVEAQRRCDELNGKTL